MPIALSFGIDPVHFGLVVVMNFAIGMITPPYGISLFVSASVSGRSVTQVASRMFWPWFVMTSVLLATTYIPELGLFLPRAFGLIQ
jgi:C4-dicarboxylate transporter DctM subunit